MDAPSSLLTDSPSFAKLRRDLGDDAALLRFLPYKRATFELQHEIPEAAPERLLYGDMRDSKGQLWIYFTLNSYNKQKNSADRMLTFQTIEGAANYEASVRPGSVQKVALASSAFKYAQGYQAVEAIAKYFFIHKGIDKQLQFPVSSGPFRESLVRACQRYKTIFDELQSKKPLGRRSSIIPIRGNHGMEHAQSHVSQESSHAASMAPSPTRFPHPSSTPSQAQFCAPSKAISRASSRHMSMDSIGGRKRQHSASPGRPDSSKDQESYTQPSRHDAALNEAGGFSSYSRPPSPYLVSARSPLHKRPDIEDVEELVVSKNKDAELEMPADADHSSSFSRDAMMDRYIALRALEEELDGKISDMEAERTSIANQVAGLQADMNAIGDRKGDLEEEKVRVLADKRKLQVQLDEDEHLDFGFEAGRRMETKRQRTE